MATSTESLPVFGTLTCNDNHLSTASFSSYFLGTHREYNKIDVAKLDEKKTTMNIRPIRSQADYERGLREIDRLWNARPGSVEEDELEAIGALVEDYEKRVYPLPHADPIEAIKFRMEQSGSY